MRSHVGAVLVLASLSACAPSTATACQDLVAAIDTAAVRCGAAPGEFEADFWRSAFDEHRASGCQDVDEIRDCESLYDSCLPFYANADCDLAFSGVPRSCQRQLLFVTER